MKNIIFYFSGTGNSLQVAKEISEGLGEYQLINLAKYDTKEVIKAERVGFVFPVYFWGVPGIMKRFLHNIKIEGTPYLFCVSTSAENIKASLSQVKILLKRQKLRLNAGFHVTMPENYIILYKMKSEEDNLKCIEESKIKTNHIIEAVKGKKNLKLEKDSMPFEILLGRIVNQYVSTFPKRDKNFVVSDECIGCGKCEQACSVSNITLINGKPTWNHHCEFCMGCIHSCPIEAINYKNITDERGRYRNPFVNINGNK